MIAPPTAARKLVDDRAAVEEERGKRLMAMGQMAASLAHEIRNPLGSMELYCSLLKQDLQSSGSALDLAEQIHQGIRRLDRIISNCLQFGRDVQPRCKELDNPLKILAEVVEDVRAQAEALGVIVEFQEQGEHGVRIDPFLLHQVLLNLVRNAVEAAAEGEKERKIVTLFSDRSESGHWSILVADNGPGIPLEDCERVFDPFVTSKPGGTGLGLAIVHSIVKAHQGTVVLRSNLGEGTVVELEFPNLVSFKQ